MKRIIVYSLLFILFILTAVAVSKATVGKKPPDYLKTTFRVEVEGVDAGWFASVDGLSVEQEVIEYKEGDDPLTRKRPGKPKYSNIVLTRSIFDNNNLLYDWHKKIIAGQLDKRNGSVIVEDSKGNEICRYNFFQAFPVKWEGPGLDASSSGSSMTETLTFAVEYIEIKT